MTDRVQAEVRNDAELAPVLGAPVAPLADCSPAQQTEQRYLTAVGVLVDDAVERKSVETLVEVLTWTLARVGAAYGPGATGDILRRLGGHLCDVNAREQAEREAAAAKKKGVATH